MSNLPDCLMTALSVLVVLLPILVSFLLANRNRLDDLDKRLRRVEMTLSYLLGRSDEQSGKKAGEMTENALNRLRGEQSI